MSTDFNTAYLQSINLIKQEEEEEKKEKCSECGKEPCECECGDTTDASNDNGEVINDDVDEQEAKDDEAKEAESDDVEDSDTDSDDEKEEKEQKQEGKEEDESTCFCFKTTNKSLIDAINSGFDKVVFTVKAKDDEGNDTTTEVEFTNDDFADFEECDCDDSEDDDSDDVTDDLTNDIEDADEDFDDEDMSFESVFKRYYGSLVGENK